MRLSVHLPDDLAQRFKRSVAPRQRSRFVERLLKAALPEAGDDETLYHVALAVERDEGLAAEMGEWEAATIADGLAEPKS
jgi:metal-responsive CopG/Arc/MetJ family transcriptional regulator